MLVLGVATSAPFAGREASGWRNKFTLAGLALAAVDLYIVATYDPVQSASPAVRAGQVPPSSLYHQITLLRPLAFTIFDGICAALMYLSATNRLVTFSASPVSQAEQIDQMVSTAVSSVSGARAKLHALSVTRNAVVRDKKLKDRDDAYWRDVVSVDAGQTLTVTPASVWEEEEVVRAMSRAMAGQGQGGVDLAKLGSSAEEYVNGITAGLENAEDRRSRE